MTRVTLLCFAAIICLIGPTYGRSRWIPRIHSGSDGDSLEKYWYLWLLAFLGLVVCCSGAFWRCICNGCQSKPKANAVTTVILQPTSYCQPGNLDQRDQ